MTTNQQQLAHEIRELAIKLIVNGWDRVRGLSLAQAATRTVEECTRINWLEAVGRASELADLFDEFAQEAPSEARLKSVLRSATALADLLEAGRHAAHQERDFLPARPEDWLFVLTGHVFDGNRELAEDLAMLGFSVTRVDSIDQADAACRADQVILIADASWLDENAERMTAILPTANDSFPASFLLIAIADTNDFQTQIKARQIGARLLLAPSPDAARLITELAGLTWMPRTAYRVMLVDDDAAVLSLHTNILQAAGFQVLAINDPVAARDFLVAFAPEACVLNVEMPVCRGTDLAALLRRDKRYTRLPIIYLSAHSDIDHQLDARHAGGEDYLIKPVDTRLLVAAVMARTQQFRMLETAYYQRQQAWKQLDNLRTAVDAHAIFSVAATDGAIVDSNRKFSEISGYSQEELIGRNHRIVKSGHHSAAFFEGMWRTISAGRIWRGEVQNRRKDGSSYWVQGTIVPILNELGRPERYLSIRTDITAQKRIQTKRQHQTRLLNLLRQALQQYLTLHDIEAFSASMLNGMLKLTDSTYGFLGEVRHEPDGATYFKPHALNNIAWNNATRSFSVTENTVSMPPSTLNSLIEAILRTGKAVSASDLAKDPTTSEDFIGLPILQGEKLIGIAGLANRSDGYDASAIANFLHPFTHTYAGILETEQQQYFQQQLILDPQRANDDSERNSDSAQRRILIAEDNPANQAVLRMQLSVLGYAADIADNGAAALLKWQAGGHDLILIDRNMPVMNGLELARAIRASERENGAHVPIIAITAAQHSEELSLCREAGMNDVLPKPIELDALQNMLERWLPHASPLVSRDNPLIPQTEENKAILDTAYLARIIGHADVKQIRNLIDLFTSTARNDLPTCRRHLAEHDSRTLSSIMHKLKSSARMVGALAFAHLAGSLEDAAKAGRLESAAALLTELEHALIDVETATSRLALSTASPVIEHETPVTAEQLPSRVLIMDEDPVARRQITLLLSSLGIHQVLAVKGAHAALTEIANGGIDLLICDLNMPGMNGIEFLRHLADNDYRGGLIIAGSVKEQVLQATAEMSHAKGVNLRGILKKPLARDALLQLFAAPCEITAAPSAQHEKIAIAPDDIQEGIRCNEFEIYFQPKVDAATLSVVGLEALARWQHNGKIVPPDIFVNIAERHGLIGPLSEVLLTKALIGGAHLAEAGYALTISVNLSAHWLSDLRLPEFILASVQATGFNPENLVLEITETSVMVDMTTVLDVMTRLRLKGFKLSIDNFGMDSSSLEQLQRIPFNELKLDKSLVQGATKRNSARAILASTLAMARKLKLSSVAEGVETQADLDLARSLGCNLVQGWFVAKAMPLDQLIAWLMEHEASTEAHTMKQG